MPRRVLRLRGSAAVDRLSRRFDAIRAGLGVPSGFPEDVLAEAEEAARRARPGDADLRGVPFVSIDPPGSTDLDQALHIAERGGGHRVSYAIADVPAFVAPGGPLDAETLERGQTLYAPDRRTPLHPPVLGEAAASLLAGVDRPAYVWTFDLDAAGEVERVGLTRGLVRNRLRLDYATVQRVADDPAAATGAGVADAALLAEQARRLRVVGERRIAAERRRGGAGLPLPDQEVEEVDGRFALRLRPPVPAEEWNAQISLMTGMAAAAIMVEGGVGLLRTMPPPDPERVAAFRREAAGLGVPWPDDETYGAFVARLDAGSPGPLALLHAAAGLFRGAGYTPLGVPASSASPSASGTPGTPGTPAAPGASRRGSRDGSLPPPQPGGLVHAAVAAPYAHVTAPLRRLVDRFGLVVCDHVLRGEPVPEPVLAVLPDLPAIMRRSDRRAGELDRACRDTVEAAVLEGREGEDFDAIVVDVRGGAGGDGRGERGTVQVIEPPVLAPCEGPVGLGERIRARLVRCDVEAAEVRFASRTED